MPTPAGASAAPDFSNGEEKEEVSSASNGSASELVQPAPLHITMWRDQLESDAPTTTPTHW
jgi:hypothetical protein